MKTFIAGCDFKQIRYSVRVASSIRVDAGYDSRPILELRAKPWHTVEANQCITPPYTLRTKHINTPVRPRNTQPDQSLLIEPPWTE